MKDLYGPPPPGQSLVEDARSHLTQARDQLADSRPYGHPHTEVRRAFAEATAQQAQVLALLAIHEELAAIRAALTETSHPRPARPWRRRFRKEDR
ncbi:hypothetical protein [Acrocarpospora catenulata]|uniref:hypothetical protein n=1 Tax=Acrocarpospora catenulata TaxID=2836182 RepID=UPI001BDA7185|nr:hypothetical protein [Acrocarpospora catenulata]